MTSILHRLIVYKGLTRAAHRPIFPLPKAGIHSFSIQLASRGIRVVKVSDRGWPCHEFEPSTTKDPPCRTAMHTVESSNASSRWCGMVVRRGGASSGHLTMVQNDVVRRQKPSCS
ncbi:hypothetical protein TNCV_1622061 [Trichonephila clavipes]|nr:hypothetical protein TNCV_1622061 [Trichonephila clavipes]